MADSTLIKRVVLKRFKSIESCDVRLGPLNFLVGPNGSGKSNFLDALRFVADSARHSFEHAAAEQGGIWRLMYRFRDEIPGNIEIELLVGLPEGARAGYRLVIGVLPGPVFRNRTGILREECQIEDASGESRHYRVARGEVISSSLSPAPVASVDRLHLVAASGDPAFRPLYDILAGMEFYNPIADHIRKRAYYEQGDRFARDGTGLPNALASLGEPESEPRLVVDRAMRQILPGLVRVEVRGTRPPTTGLCLRLAGGDDDPAGDVFDEGDVSDGTLRALAIVTALVRAASARGIVPLVGVEEPEAGLHPGAVRVLLDCLRDVSETTQVIVTSHSPDLLDDPDIDADSIRYVENRGGSTRIGPINEAARSVLKKNLYTPGELLRLDQLGLGGDQTFPTAEPGQPALPAAPHP